MLIDSDGKAAVIATDQEPWNLTFTPDQVIYLEYLIQNYIDNINDHIKENDHLLISGISRLVLQSKQAEDILNSIKDQIKDKKITVIESV